MFSPELMTNFSNDLNCLNKQISLTRTFEILYNQSFSFHIFQSYVQYTSSIQYACEMKQNEPSNPDLNQFVTEFTLYSDLRVCECADYVMTVYIKLVEYHTNLYEMYEKMVEEKRDTVRLKHFDRIMYYRMEICQLLLRCQCFQRLLVEIENGRKFLDKFFNDTNNHENFSYRYQYFLVKHTYDFFQATLLKHSRAIHESKQICDQSLKDLRQAYEQQIWEKLVSNTDSPELGSLQEKRQQYEYRKDSYPKESSLDSNYSSQFSIVSVSEDFIHTFFKQNF